MISRLSYSLKWKIFLRFLSLELSFYNQLPTKGLPNNPTANSIQIKRNIKRIIVQAINLVIKAFFDLITRWMIKATPKSKIVAIMKSKKDQFQPSIKRFPKNAITSNTTGTPKIYLVFCFCVIVIIIRIFNIKVL